MSAFLDQLKRISSSTKTVNVQKTLDNPKLHAPNAWNLIKEQCVLRAAKGLLFFISTRSDLKSMFPDTNLNELVIEIYKIALKEDVKVIITNNYEGDILNLEVDWS